MTFKANLIRAVIMIGITLAAVILTDSLAYADSLAICIVAAGGSLFIGTGVGLEIDSRAARKRHRGTMERVR